MNLKRRSTLARNTRHAWILGLPLVCGALVAAASCSSTPPPSSVAEGCSINSDCDKDLICAFGKCHSACRTSTDCMGATCLPPKDVCELASESTCSDTLPCVSGLTCADSVCRAPCDPKASNDTTGGCLGTQTCVPGSKSTQGVCVDSPRDGGAGGKGDGGARDASSSDAHHDGAKADGSSGADANSCPSAQTQFSFTAVGDTNPNFTSSVGVRTAKELLVFSGYNGPDPSGDGGDAGNVNLVYWQAFDPTTAKSLGRAKPLDLFDSTSLGTILLEDVSVAPTGEVALLYSHIVTVGSIGANGLSAAFFPSSTDAGSTPQNPQVVTLESDFVGDPPQVYAATEGQPHVIWSTSSAAFVCSWTYYPSALAQAKVAKFLPSGAGAGGNTDTVPISGAYVVYEGASVGTSRGLFGVAYLNSNIFPGLTVLDPMGNQVGTSIQIGDRQPSAGGNSGYNWVTVGGTDQGLVYFEGTDPVTEWFIPTLSDGGGVESLPDGGTYSGFTFPGMTGSVIGRAISDDTGGAGGVGAVVLLPDGATFLYVHADGATHVGPNQVISQSQVAGDEVAITQYGGSFGVSLYSAAEHRTRMTSSGCQ